MTPLISRLLYIITCTTSCKGNKTQNRKNVTFGKVFCTVHYTLTSSIKKSVSENVTGKEENSTKQSGYVLLRLLEHNKKGPQNY